MARAIYNRRYVSTSDCRSVSLMSQVEDEIRLALQDLLTIDNDREQVLQLLAATKPKLSESDRLTVVKPLIQLGAYQSFGLILQRFPKDEEVCVQVLKSVGWFARDSESVPSMVEHNLPSLLIRTLRRHITSPPLVVVAVSILADSSTNMHFQNLVRIHDGIQTIADAISIHKANVKILDTCFYCLANLTVQSPDNIAVMVECGCIGSVLEASTKYSNVATLIEAALIVVMNVCRSGPNEQRVVADLKGAETLHIVLKTIGQAGLLKHVILAIGAFAQTLASIDQVLEQHTIDLIAKRLYEFRNDDDESLLEAGIAVFTHLVTNCSERALIPLIDTRMIAVTLLIAKNRWRSAAVQTAVLQLLLSLYSRCSRSQVQLLATVRLLSIPAALSAIHLFPDRGPIAIAAVTLLGAILTDNNARCRLEQIDILPSVVAVGLHQIADLAALRIVLDVLAELSTASLVTAQSLKDTQLLELIEYILVQGETHVSVLDSSLQLLQRLVSFSDLSDLVGSKLGARLVAMLNSPNIAKISAGQTILAICGEISLSSTGAETMIQLGILNITVRLMADEARNALLVSIILECLRKVMRTSLMARAALKEMGATKLVEALRFQHSADAKVTRASNDFLHDVESTAVVFRSKATGKAIASVDEFKLPELDQNIRLFLCAGGVLTKHCKKAAPRKRQVFVSTDLRFLVWKEPNKKPRSFFLDSCDKVVSGRSSPELLRESILFTPASENLSFSIFMKDGRRLSLEAPTEQLRDQWVKCVDSLIRYRQALAKLTVKENILQEQEFEKEDFYG